MTQYETRHIAVIDPRTLDGDPFTVARKAAEQAAGLVLLASEAVEKAQIMARNSWMEAELAEGRELQSDGWMNTPYSGKWDDAAADLKALSKTLVTLGKAAGFDPKHPPKVDA